MLKFGAEGKFDPKFVQDVIPKIFIGVGGTGGKMIERIYNRLMTDEHWKKYKEPCTGFLVIDTNFEDLQSFENNGKIRKFHTAQAGRAEIIKKLIYENDHFLAHWRPENYEPRNSALGAGQIRIESRIGFYAYSDLIAHEIDAMLGDISEYSQPYLNQDQNVVEVYVFATLAGGTGSGCFLPMAYLLRERIEASGRNPRLQAFLMTSHSLTSRVKPEIHDYIHANTYAALKELEHLNRVAYGYPPIPFAYRKPRHNNEKMTLAGVPPFNWTAIIDSPVGMTLELNDAWKAVADTAYLNFITPARAAEHGERDNYTRFMRALLHPTISQDGPLDDGYTKHFGSAGSAALICPSETLLTYCEQMFTGYALRSQLCLKSKRNEKNSQEMNFNDPKFIQLGKKTKIKILNSQWLKAVDDLHLQDKVNQEEHLQWLINQGLDPEEAKEAAQKAGYWYQLVHAVNGEDADELAAFDADDDDDWGDDEEEDKAQTTFIALRRRVQNLINLSMDGKLPIIQIKKIATMKLPMLLSFFQEHVQDFENKRKDFRRMVDMLKEKAREGYFFEQLRKDQTADLDAMRERYLVLTILKEDIEGWISQAQNELEAVENSSIWTEKGRDSTRKTLDAILNNYNELQPGNIFEATWDKLSGQDDVNKAHASSLAGDANKEIAKLIRQTNTVTKMEAKVEILEAFQEFLQERANSYAELSLIALDFADELEEKAENTLIGDLKVDNYILKMEALRPIDAKSNQERYWPWAWEDHIRPKVQAALQDATFLGETISTAIQNEEKRSTRESSEFDAKRVVRDIKDKFFEKASQSLSKMILGDVEDENENGISLTRMLELEAIYTFIQNQDNQKIDAGERQKLVKEVLESLEDPRSPNYQRNHEIIVNYLKAKMRALKRLAQPLGQIDYNQLEGVPYSKTPILIASNDALAQFGVKYKDALKVLTEGKGSVRNLGFNVESKVGQQVWSDPRVLVLYQGVAVVPVYAFSRVMEIHGNYETILNDPGRKVNALHISRRWESSLLDLLPERRRQRMEDRREKEETDFYAKLIDVNLLQYTDGEWVLQTPAKDNDPSSLQKFSLGDTPTQALRALPKTFEKFENLRELFEGWSTGAPTKENAAQQHLELLDNFLVHETVQGRGGEDIRLQPIRQLVKALQTYTNNAV